MSEQAVILRADRWVDVDEGNVRSPAVIVVIGNRIAAVNPIDTPAEATEIDLGDVTLLPGLMDMELNDSSYVDTDDDLGEEALTSPSARVRTWR